MDATLARLKKKLPGITSNVSLSKYTSFKIGGPAKYFFIAKNSQGVILSVKAAKKEHIEYFILGSGTNVLISDKGFDGLVIKMENNSIKYAGPLVTAEAGTPLQKLVHDTAQKNLCGLEFLAGIPGTVGGGVAGNVGTPDEWIDKHLTKVDILNINGETESILKPNCDFSYRFSRFKYDNQDIILSATWQLSQGSKSEIQSRIQSYIKKRGHQPVGLPCAGSIFKNPPGEKAWKLIDQLGLRGKRIGGAKVSDQHANFILNDGHATAEDVIILISYIKQQVRDTLGIQLQEEIKYVGF